MTLPIAKKSLGQHWLNDETSLRAICDAAKLTKKDVVLEIGPGTGALTRHLVNLAGQVIAVEKDKNLAAHLINNFNGRSFYLHIEDILHFNLTKLPKGYKIVANIPYYLTNHLLRLLSETNRPPSIAVLLVQKEVAERVTAKPGAMSLLSVSVQLYYEVSLGQTVPAKLFTPPPKVDSQILILGRRKDPLFPVEPQAFFKVVKAGFSARRKKLRSSLSGGLGISKEQAENLLQSAGINPGRRAQELSLADWHKLYKIFLAG